MTRTTAGAMVAVLLAWLIFFSPILFTGQVYWLDDLKILFYPLERSYQDAQDAGHLPLWSNLFGFGHPIMAWSQLGFFTPLHILLRAVHVPPLQLLQISVMGYFALGLAGMVLWLRALKFSAAAAALGAIVFVFSGYNIGHLNHVNFYTATMLAPWLWLAIHSLLEQPSWRRGALVSLLASAIAISGHPQASLYTLLMAAAWGIISGIERVRQARKAGKAALYVRKVALITAGVMAVFLGIASITLLPLFEFLPLTERAQNLPTYELYEFSYVPWHAITLIAPYFFGDHTSYWGAKGFQELAAYVGIIPLLLAGSALANWSSNKTVRWTGAIFLLAALLLAPGIYSPAFRYAVDHGWITSLAIPGRFVVFFTSGISLLAAVGIDDLKKYRDWPLIQRLRTLILALALPSAALAPFFWHLSRDPAAFIQLQRLIILAHPSFLLFIGGILIFFTTVWIQGRRSQRIMSYALASLAAVTLLIFSWNYNPRSSTAQALAKPPFADQLQEFEHQNGWPARVYSRERIAYLLPEIRLFPTPSISSSFSFYQPLNLAQDQRLCFTVPMHSALERGGSVAVSLRTEPLSPALSETSINSLDILNKSDQSFCLPVPDSARALPLYLSFTSEDDSGINLYYEASPSAKSAYLVRVANPSDKQLRQSQKFARLRYTIHEPTIDPDLILLPRHLQAAFGIGGARWISALAIDPYRQYIEKNLANDSDQLADGDGRHILDANRTYFDRAGITHFIQALPPGAQDMLPQFGLEIKADEVAANVTYRLYHNPQAYPKAFIVDEAGHPLEAGSARLTHYSDQSVEVAVETARPARLVLTDSSVPQWQAFIDGQMAPYIMADGFFRAVDVPPGKHLVQFRYRSPAVERAKIIGFCSAGLALLALVAPRLRYAKI